MITAQELTERVERRRATEPEPPAPTPHQLARLAELFNAEPEKSGTRR